MSAWRLRSVGAKLFRGQHYNWSFTLGRTVSSDSRALAAQAQSVKASAIAALCPSYFKPKSVGQSCRLLHRNCECGAGDCHFTIYDIPSFTGVQLSMPEFLQFCAEENLRRLAGLKFTNPDLVAYQKLLRRTDGRSILPGVSMNVSLARSPSVQPAPSGAPTILPRLSTID